MEKRKESYKSKTPVRTYLEFISEESSTGEYRKAGTSTVGLTENTFVTESPERKGPSRKDWMLAKDKSKASCLYDDLEPFSHKPKEFIEDVASSQEKSKKILTTMKAQNKTLHKELNSCRTLNYELDVELYIVKESLNNKEKVIEQLALELNRCKSSEKALIEENNCLKEELKNTKSAFDDKIGRSLQKNQELQKIIDQNKIFIAELTLKTQQIEKSPKRNGSEKKFSLEKLKIPRNYSPEKQLNMTERCSKSGNSLMNDLMTILAVDAPMKVMSEVIQLKESQKLCRRYKKFFRKLAAVVVDCSPDGFFESEPSMQHIWRWITRLLEEYMKLKQLN